MVPIESLRPALEGGPVKILHNAKFDWQYLWQSGIVVEPIFDTMLADQVIPDRDFGLSLKDLCNDYLHIDLPKDLQKSDWSGELTDEQVEYARRDAQVLPDLARSLSVELRKLELSKL